MTAAEDHFCMYGCLICLERKTLRRPVAARVLDRLHGEALAEDARRAKRDAENAAKETGSPIDTQQAL